MTFEKEFEALVIILGKMKQQYAFFKETLIKQRAAIIANDKNEMTEILDKIEGIYESINLLENRRIYNMGILAQNAGSEIKTIRDVVKAFPEFDGKKTGRCGIGIEKNSSGSERYFGIKLRAFGNFAQHNQRNHKNNNDPKRRPARPCLAYLREWRSLF